MCYFINIGFPKTNLKQIFEIFPRGIKYIPSENKYFIDLLPDDYASYYIIRDGCSCGLYHNSEEENENMDFVKLRNKYKKRGWNSSKIERAINDIKTTNDKRPAFQSKYGLDLKLAEWLDRIYKTGKFETYIHIQYYHGKTDIQEINVKKKITIDMTKPDPEDWFPEECIIILSK